ncbi:DUF4124 domain-containing protein [Marilutibacter aestuarii]|uniref:DUF4124 domain-containing protein n=1 Tax=Marilutibacter aestuarii TaxID=1706195 RepID=A0A507ZTB1_9GAMM|nr:DUF4124 domain-containing protein [Lysobacter aestuarii]TQD38968.1 DUF4124 domain-containing protein [Lysobacter aestuarii]
MSRQTLPCVPVTPSPRRGLLLAALLMASVTAVAGEVYQWKDANGVTHYSDSPPAGHEYKNRSIHASDPAVSRQEGDGQPVVTAQCASARANLAQLETGTPVGIDEDGDGKADGTLNEAQRAAQKQLAEAAIQVHCQASTPNQGASGDA